MKYRGSWTVESREEVTPLMAATKSTTSQTSDPSPTSSNTNGGGSTTANGKWGTLETEIKRVDPKTLKRREVNARYIPEEFKRLVENVRLDGGLTSAVLTCSLPDGGLEILSGHHRTAAAVEAGIATIEVINISTLLTEERKKAIQLSHNAINGKDNQSILAELYSDLSLDAKIFSGLTDEILNLDKLDIAGLGAGNLETQEIRIAFLPEDREGVRQHPEQDQGQQADRSHSRCTLSRLQCGVRCDHLREGEAGGRQLSPGPDRDGRAGDRAASASTARSTSRTPMVGWRADVPDHHVLPHQQSCCV